MTSSTSRGRGYRRRPVRDRLAHGEVAVHPAALQHDADALAQRPRAAGGIDAEHRHDPARARCGSPRGSRPSSSCPRRWARAARTPRRARPRSRCRARPRCRRRTCAGRGPGSRGLAHATTTMTRASASVSSRRVRCACIDIGSNTTRLLVAEPARDGRLREVLSRARLHAPGQPPRTRRRDPARRRARRARRWSPSRSRLAARQGAVIGPRRRHRGDPRRRQPRRAVPPRSLDLAGVPVEVLTGEEEARLAFRGATRIARRASRGRASASSTSAAARPSSWSARCRRRRLVGLVSGRLGPARRRASHRRPADAGRSSSGPRARRRRVRGLAAPPQPVAAYAVGGSATSLRRLLGAVLDADALAARLRALLRCRRAEDRAAVRAAPRARARCSRPGSCSWRARRARFGTAAARSAAAGCARAWCSSEPGSALHIRSAGLESLHGEGRRRRRAARPRDAIRQGRRARRRVRTDELFAHAGRRPRHRRHRARPRHARRDPPAARRARALRAVLPARGAQARSARRQAAGRRARRAARPRRAARGARRVRAGRPDARPRGRGARSLEPSSHRAGGRQRAARAGARAVRETDLAGVCSRSPRPRSGREA